MSINKGMNKENVVYVDDGILSSHNEECSKVICRKMDATGNNREK